MTAPFSWTDTARIALGSCMPCLRPVWPSDSLNTNRRHTSTSSREERAETYKPTMNRIPRARPDELQGLLAGSSDEETLSLHSNPRGRPPIQLPDDGAEDQEHALLFPRHRSGSSTTPTTTLTTQTFDSDAAPLHISTIQEITVSKATEAVEAEVNRLKEKEERRQRRKARKAMKRLVEAGIVGDGEEFEGFQGSGGLALLKRPSGAGGGTTATSSSGSHSRSHSQSQQFGEDFGHFVSAPPPAEEDDEEADLDGSLYARKKSKSGTHSNEGASDSRRNRPSASRTSASASDRAHHHQPLPNSADPKSKRSPTSQSRSRSNTSSQSPSLASPSSSAFSEAQIVSPSTVEQGQGFFDLEDDRPVREEGVFPGRIGGGEFPGGRIGGGSFPMTGFAGAGNSGGEGGKRSRDFGVFLARRGDEEEKGRVGDV